MKSLSFATLFVLYSLLTAAQNNAPTIKEYKKVFTTYPFSDPDPIPKPDSKIYPYYRFDGFTDIAVQKEWKVVELENDYIKLVILPEVGGKVWSATEKSTGRDFVYNNHVVKFRDVAMRGPWTSGGVEANYGIVGHTPNCATPVDFITIKKDDGSVSCVIGVLDLLTRTSWRVDINLPKDKAYFTTNSFWFNSTQLCIVMEDLNKDGKKDILLAGNNTWTRIKFGRYSANHGVLLLGDGKSNFTYLPQLKSGLTLKGNVKSLKFINAGKIPKIIAGVNDDNAILISGK